jgi:hypothetical protein
MISPQLLYKVARPSRFFSDLVAHLTIALFRVGRFFCGVTSNGTEDVNGTLNDPTLSSDDHDGEQHYNTSIPGSASKRKAQYCPIFLDSSARA